MSTVTKPITPEKGKEAQHAFLFDKQNYMWMICGIVLIFIGFMLLSGGKSPDPHVFNNDELYSVRRITVAPIMILLGFAIEVYAIMKKPAETNEPASEKVA